MEPRLTRCPCLLYLACAAAAPSVVFEVYPAPTCPNCRLMIEEGFVPLVEAGLPGEQVQVIVIPWVSEKVGPDGLYVPDPASPYDQLASAQVCAMRSVLQQPMPIDSPVLVGAVKFIVCDDKDIQSRKWGRRPDGIQSCAEEAGLPWAGPNGLEVCEKPETGFSLMHGLAYSRIVGAMKGRHWTSAPYMFLNGEPLNCPGPTFCTSVWTPSGDRPLKKPGSLVEIACSMLDPLPPACGGVSAPLPPAAPPTLAPAPAAAQATTASAAFEISSTAPVVTTSFCENCWEVGSFRWSTKPQRRQIPLHVLGLVGVMVGAGTTGLFSWRHMRGLQHTSGDTTLVWEQLQEEGVEAAAVE